MPVYHRTRRLQIYGDKPEVTTLFGNRYQMVVRCEAKHDTEAWYNSNKSQIFADFGTLYDAEMAIDGIEPRTGEAYDNMVLVSNEAGYTGGEYVVTFVYQTLTADFVQEAADKVDYELNGLRRVTRPLIAKDGSDYYNVPDAMVVEGAGTAAVNGVYRREGDSGGNPRYTLVGGTTNFDSIIYGFGSWYIVTSNTVVYDSTDDLATPDLVVTWVSVVGDVVPTVRRATWADIDAAGIDPATVPVLSGSEKVIGTSTISHTEHGYDTETLTLASAVEDSKGPNEGGYVRIVETWVEPGILNVSTPKVGGQQRVTVQVIGMTEADVTSALSEVTANHKLIEVSKGNFEGFSTADYTFEVDDFVVLTATENDLTVVRRTQLSASTISRGTINDTALTVNGNTYVLRQEELDNDGIIKKSVGFYVRYEAASFPETTLFEIDRRYGIAVPVKRQVVPFGTSGEITSTQSVQVEPVDAYRSLRFTTLESDLPVQQIWFERRNVGFPVELKGISVVGTETPTLVPNYREPPSSPLKVRITRKFYWGTPPEGDDGDSVRDFRDESFAAAVEVDVTSNNTSVSNSSGNSTTTSNSTNNGTSNTQSTSQNTTSSTSNSTTSSTNNGTSSSTNNGTSSTTSQSTNNGTSNSTNSGTSSSTNSGTSNSSNQGTSNSTNNGTSNSTNSGTSNSRSDFNGRTNSDTAAAIDRAVYISDTTRSKQTRTEGFSASTGNTNTTNTSNTTSNTTSSTTSSTTSNTTSTSNSTTNSTNNSTSSSTNNSTSTTTSQSTNNGTFNSTNNGTSNSTNSGTSNTQGTSSNTTESTNNGTSQNTSNSSSTTTSQSTGKRIINLSLRACLRAETVISVKGTTITVPATVPTGLPWDEYTLLTRNASHWKHNIWVEEIAEALLPPS